MLSEYFFNYFDINLPIFEFNLTNKIQNNDIIHKLCCFIDI